MKKDFVFMSESVTEGHPDKLCDQISDAMVDRFLQHDPLSRVIAECAMANSVVFLSVRFASHAVIDFSETARSVIDMAGYVEESFNSKTCSVITSIRETLADPGADFDETRLDKDMLASIAPRNQGTVFGFACTQTPAMLPLPIWLAHKAARRLASVRIKKIVSGLSPDGKTQIGVEYQEGRPCRIDSVTVLAARERGESISPGALEEAIRQEVIKQIFIDEAVRMDEKTRIFINPEGTVYGGGPQLHSGLTGRKNAIDTYGEYSRHSGAALSGKDPLRIDRVGAYAARYAAKNVVAAGLAAECEVQLSYSIGVAEPVSIQVETFGTARGIDDDGIMRLIRRHFDFRLAAIVRDFRLRRLPQEVRGGFYRRLAAYGHMGRMDIGLPWEVTDKAQALRGEARPSGG